MKKNRMVGSSVDNFLRKEGILEESEALAIKETIAWQLDRAMKQKRISKKQLAELMRTSRTQVDRVLNPKNGNVTIETLQKAAAVVGRKVKVELV